MIGTIVNTCTIIVGALIGAMLKKGIKPQYQTALFNAMGVVSLAIGLRAFITYMPQSQYPVLFIVFYSLFAYYYRLLLIFAKKKNIW